MAGRPVGSARSGRTQSVPLSPKAIAEKPTEMQVTGLLSDVRSDQLVSTFGNAFGDWFFMISLLLIGIAFLVGAGLRLAGVGGALLMLFMYVVALPQPSAMVDGEFVRGATNPIPDVHWMDALLLLICAFTVSGDTLGLGKWWARLPFVRANPWLR